jgi:integrase
VLKYLELDELKQLFSTPPPKSKYDVKTICLFAFYTLLRVSDIYSLKWKNIVKIGGSWYIQKNIQKIQSEKIIALNEQAVSLLPERGQDDDYVFNLFQHKFKKVHNFGITMDGLIRKWAKSAGLTKKVSMHTFRHSGATAMVTAGVDIYTISKQLTHSSIATSQIYAQVVLDKQKEAANKMPKVF